MDRRDFIKTSAMAAATLAASRAGAAPEVPKGKALPVLAGSPSRRVVGNVVWDKAPCRFCGTGCQVQVGVENGKIVAIAGDQQAEVNKGLLCVKGYHVGLALYGSDRLTRPLLRKNGKLEPISWEEAIDTIAKRIQRNPKSFGFYGSGQWTIPEGFAANKFMKGGLSNNHIDPNARLCMASAVTGFMATYGVDEPPGCFDDLDKCEVLILWGNNMAEMHPVLFSRVVDRRARGEKVTIIDFTTRRTRTSAFADHVYFFKPHSDLALANGIARELIEKGTWDKEFVEKHCAFRAQGDKPELNGVEISFDEYKKRLAEYTPEKVEQISGVPASAIRMLGEMFGKRDLKITSVWCMGANQHTRGTAMNCLLHSLHHLSGHFGKPGDSATSLTGQPSACGTVRETGTLAHGLPGGLVVPNEDHRKKAEKLWNLPDGRISPKPGHHTVQLFTEFSKEGGDIDTLWVQVTNPGQSLPNIGALIEKSRKLKDKFLIVSDVYPTRTTSYADLVLPSALWVEKNGMYGNSERRTHQWFKMVEPPGEAREDLWQIIAVAKRLLDLGNAGMKDKEGKFLFRQDKDGKEVPIWDYKHFHDINVDERLFEEYRPFTRFKNKDLAPYSEYVKARGLRWPVVKQADGTWRETKWRFSEFDDPYVSKGAGFEFYHSTSKNKRAQIWSYPYEPPPEVPDGEFPFWLTTGRVIEHWHTGTMTMRIPPLRRAMPQAYLEMNRDDAQKLGVQNGDVVVVESRRGTIELPVWVEGRAGPPKGTVFIPFFDEVLLANYLTLEAHDPFSKQPDYKKCAVKVRRRKEEVRPG